MARLVNIDDVTAGYFWTSEFTEVVSYVQAYLDKFHEPILFIIHASAIFIKEDDEEEIHLSPSTPLHIDPDIPDLSNLIELMFEDLHDPESWSELKGSGFQIVLDSFTYWFKIISYNPNNRPWETNYNSKSPFDDDNDLRPTTPPPRIDAANPPSVPTYDPLYYALAAYFVPNTQRYSHKRMVPKYKTWLNDNDFNPLTFEADRITMGNIGEWHEQMHKYNLRVFSAFGNVIYERKFEPHDDFIDLLYKYRKFKLITNLWTLLNEKRDRIFCSICKKFHSKDVLCKKVILPSYDETVKVPTYPKGRHFYVIYADFESIVTSSNEHKCSGYAFISIDGKKIKIIEECENSMTLNGDPEDIFIRQIFAAANDFAFGDVVYEQGGGDLITAGIGIATSVLVNRVAKRFRRTHICPLCDEEVVWPHKYVQGRNFINGKLGRHHSDCWYNNKNAPICYFHNFRGYDSHYVLKSLMKSDDYEVDVVRGKSFEKFDVISAISGKIRITFKDTFNYLATSIAKLVQNVENWTYTPEKDRDMKGTFPYKWFDDISKLCHNKLPPTTEWFNDLTHTNVDPTPARELWKREKFTTFSEFHNYYMLTDVYQLADIFEEFRESCLKAFDLDPVYFQGAPGYTWQLSTQQSADKMFIIPDVKIYQDIQANIRGGIAQVMHRYMNIENMPDENILFLDVNSLYSKCMTYKLPTKFLREINYLPVNWMDIYNQNTDLTAIVCVDLAYPEYLHDAHIAYPLAPHKFNGRLCTTFLEKEKYLCHIEALAYYLNEGMILTNFHYGYEFNHDYILASYVNGNIEKRRSTNSAPLKTLYKLLNNSLYGKTCENKFKYRKFRINQEDRGLFGKINSFLRNATNWLPIENKILTEEAINKVVLDKPIQIGFAVLELAKIEMYKFLFEVQKLFKDDVTPLYTDTDSIILHFKHPHPEELLFEHLKAYLDFDKVPSHWKVHTPGTHKQSGLWSLETLERIVEFIGVRAKTYCYRTATKTVIKNKGITATAKELRTHEALSMEHYKDSIFNNKEIKVCQVTIGSKKHVIETKRQVKLAISNNDEKRQILPDKITSIPFGYKGEKFAEYIIHNQDNL
uniref:DNA-directed DNA polymerase n=1 Tax=Parvoviridae sp. TaxID=1940570 RepID=A0A7D3UK57_9VIRU|nr:MAG: structural protein [Parvoviridae sp.]